MALPHRLLTALLLLWIVSPSMGARAQSVADPLAGIQATVPTPPIAFVAIPPCRLVDTRGNGFTGAFGPPSMLGNTSRVFPWPTTAASPRRPRPSPPTWP